MDIMENSNQSITICQADPHAGYRKCRNEIDQAIKKVLESGRYILGREVETFENEFSEYLAAPHVIGVGSGTAALMLALKAGNVGPGDLVLTVSLTAVATVAAIEQTGATPIFVDINPLTFTMDPESLEQTIRFLESKAGQANASRLKAIVPVHLYGCPVDMPAVMKIARRHNLLVIEDCAQSHGATIENIKTGCWGDLAAFSFYPTKNLGAIGDGGAVVTGDARMAKRLKQLREYGWDDRRVSIIPGINSRLDELQAAILRVKLRYLDTGNQQRGQIAAKYRHALISETITLPPDIAGCGHVYHQFVVRSRDRDRLKHYLHQHGIQTLIHYPLAAHQHPAYIRHPPTSELAQTESVTREILSLPIYPELSNEAVGSVCKAIVGFFNERPEEL